MGTFMEETCCAWCLCVNLKPPDLSVQSAWIISLRAFLAACFIVAQCECTTHSCITQRRGVSNRWTCRQNLSAGALLWVTPMKVGLKPIQLWAVLLLKNLHIYSIFHYMLSKPHASCTSQLFYSAEIRLETYSKARMSSTYIPLLVMCHSHSQPVLHLL